MCHLLFPQVTSRYLLYLEDDWKYLASPSLNTAFRNRISSYFSACDGQPSEYSLSLLIRGMVDILERSGVATQDTNGEMISEPIAQILFNEQCDSYCARGLVTTDDNDNMSSHDVPPVGTERRECDMGLIGHGGWMRSLSPSCFSGEQRNASADILYQLHEFGLAGGINVGIILIVV